MSNIGFRVFKKIHRPDPKLIEGYKNIPVAVIGDVMGRIYCLNARLKPLNKAPLLGPALTVKARVGDNMMFHHALDLAQPGDIIVVDGQGDLVNALAGENMMNWCLRRRIGGVVVDGAMRDIDAISRMPIPVFCSGVQPNGPYKNGPGEVNVPIVCGGVSISPGDVMVGDSDGVIAIASQDASEILKKARAKSEQEARTGKAISDGTWDRSSYSEKTLEAAGCQFIDDYYSKELPRS
jgi:regulator of RNase E activity RraA